MEHRGNQKPVRFSARCPRRHLQAGRAPTRHFVEEKAIAKQETPWDRELNRRIRVYEEIEGANSWSGRLGAVDYSALFGLTVVLLVGFWIWGH